MRRLVLVAAAVGVAAALAWWLAAGEAAWITSMHPVDADCQVVP